MGKAKLTAMNLFRRSFGAFRHVALRSRIGGVPSSFQSCARPLSFVAESNVLSSADLERYDQV